MISPKDTISAKCAFCNEWGPRRGPTGEFNECDLTKLAKD